jgi:peptidoglycan hydrolase CwlO-like protein
MQRDFGFRRGALVVAAGLAGLALMAGACDSFGDLGAREQALQQGISADTGRLQAYEGALRDLRARLAAIESSLAIQQTLLIDIQSQLAAARAERKRLQGQLAGDRQVLAAQLVSQYESPSPDVVGVVLESHGFTDLLERIDQMKQIAQHNATVVKRVAREQQQVAALTARLAQEEARQQRVTTAVLIERDQVATIQLTVLEHERVVATARARKQAELSSVRHELAALQARAAVAQSASFALPGAAGAGYTGGGFNPHGGDYGFFPAPGTNYSVGEEPEIAARLDALGKALQLHLIGISGYRSPQHSVEVGGFANDPHTRGEASDTPGVEGIPESTLLQFGLTRPFPGAAEADHIQLA